MAEPFLLMVAGPNGSGKTTLIQWLRDSGVEFGEYINPDDIASELQGSHEARAAQAQIIADRRRGACIEARRSFSFETVMSHPSKVDTLARAKEAGFFVQLFFVGTDDPQINVERVTLRVAQGGHDVPHDKIVSRWTRSMEQLASAIRSSDQAYVFDNSAAGNASAAPRLVFRRTVVDRWAVPQIRQFHPIPAWVHHYVFEPLGISPLIVYLPQFQRPAPTQTVVDMVGAHAADLAAADKNPPHNLAAEQVLLGAILVNNDIFYQVCDFLQPEYFYEPIHQRIYEQIHNTIRAGKVANPEFLQANLPDIHIPGQKISDYVTHLAAMANAEIIGVEHGRMVFNLALRRNLIFMCQEISNIAYNAPTDLDPWTLLLQADRRLFELAEAGRYRTGLQSFSKALISAIDQMAGAYTRDEVLGPATGFIHLDRMTGGLQKSDLIILAGAPGMGKSALAINIAYNMARAWQGDVAAGGQVQTRKGAIVGYFSLEMSAEQLATRIISAQSEVPTHRIRRGDISEAEFDRIAAVTRQTEAIPLHIDDTGGLSIEQIAARARRLKRQRGLDLLVVDDLQVLESSTRRASVVGSNARPTVTAGLKALAKELSVPVLAISQMLSQRENRERSHPVLSDLRAVGSSELDADMILFLFREEYYLQQEEPPIGTDSHLRWQAEMEAVHAKAEVIIAKNLHGPTGSVVMWFNAAISRFSDVGSL